MAKYLDMTGLTYLISKIIALINAKSDKNHTHNYLSGLSVSGKTITYTKGDGTSGTITTQDTNTTYSNATTSADGLMSSSDKSKLDGVENGATKTTIDSALSSTSTNPVQNKIINNALSNINPTSISAGYTNKSFYINTHPENSGAIIPFINNDIAFLLKRGGSAKIYYDDVEKSVDIANVFDGSPSYWSIDASNITKIVIELTLHKTFTWTNTVYVDFGAVGWRSTYISIDVINTNNNESTWTNKSTITNNTIGEHKVTFSHNDGTGFNKVRFTFSGWNSAKNFRIACLGIINYGSSGLRETFVPKDGGSVYGGITPYSTNSINLGSADLKWNNVYATTFNGALSGNASTATKSTQDSDGQQINKTYIKGLSVSGTTITYTKGDNTTGTITTQDTNTTYTHPTTSGNKHIPSGGSSGQVLKWSEDGTATWGTDNNTTYSAGTGISLSGTTFSNSGVRSIASGTANGTISVNTNGTSTDVAVKGLGSSAYTDSTDYATSSHTHTISNISDLTATTTELNYCGGVTSNIQTQLNGKAASSHGTHVTYGTSATALGTSAAGSATTVSRSDHVHALPALTSCTGTLTVAKGGTGATTAAAALTNLGITYGTSALTAGTSSLTTGAIYLQYE